MTRDGIPVCADRPFGLEWPFIELVSVLMFIRDCSQLRTGFLSSPDTVSVCQCPYSRGGQDLPNCRRPIASIAELTARNLVLYILEPALFQLTEAQSFLGMLPRMYPP